MKENLTAQLLLQTVWEVDRILLDWQEKILSNRYLQLGTDVELVKEIEADLLMATQHVKRINAQFNLRQVPVNQAKTYYLARSRFKKASYVIGQIRREAYGSFDNTQLCLKQLELCSESIQEIGQAISNQQIKSRFQA